jgi:hypothetical protein
MVPTEQYEQHADGRWEQHKTVLGERIGENTSAAFSTPSDPVDCLLVMSVQWRKVEIRGCRVNIYIFVRSSEHAVVQSGNQGVDEAEKTIIAIILTCE